MWNANEVKDTKTQEREKKCVNDESGPQLLQIED